MKHEMDKVRALHVARGLPVPDQPPKHSAELALQVLSIRRSVRMMSDGLINEGLLSSSALETARGIAATMVAASGAMVALGIEPTLEDFVLAAKELVEDARIVLDKGVHSHEWDQARIGTVMLGIVCMGIAAALGIPYHEVFDELVAAQTENREDATDKILMRCGILRAANDPEVPDGSKAT